MEKFICPACGQEDAHWCTGKKANIIPVCLHESCTSCNGTGRKISDGTMCIHFISCPCPKCTPTC